MNDNELRLIVDRITQGKYTETDLYQLHQLLTNSDQEQLSLQLGKFNVNIGNGKDIHIGDRIYQQWDEEAINALVKAIQATNTINQDNSGQGDNIGRDKNETNTYHNCTFIQLLAQGNNLNDSFPQDVINKLDFSAISEGNIQQAYKNALPPDANLYQNIETNEISQILAILKNFRRIAQFFELLSQDQDLATEIRNQCREIATQLTSKKHPKENNNQPNSKSSCGQNEILESYLIATLTSEDDSNQGFLLNAWLIPDESIKDISMRFISLLEDESKQGIFCNLTEISQQLNKFLDRALKYLRGKRHNLTIEFFVASDLMCMEIDRWKISDPTGDDICIGIQYPIRLRSLERLNIRYLDRYQSQWYDYWDKFNVLLDQQPLINHFEHLKMIDDFNWKLLKNNLQDKIGLKVTVAHPQSIRKYLFRAILQATTPIAIWLRNDIPQINQATEIDKVISFKPLRYLCESVKKFRADADALEENHLGLHLALLWENPHRLTPNVEIELKETGQ